MQNQAPNWSIVSYVIQVLFTRSQSPNLYFYYISITSLQCYPMLYITIHSNNLEIAMEDKQIYATEKIAL